MMSENTQTGIVNYDNFVLKCWLYCIGPVRRCEELKKLKADLQNLGLSRRQVHQGLMQIATKPRVVLTRQLPHRRYRFKNSSEGERGRNITDNLRANTLNLRLGNENIHKSNMTERFIKEQSKYIKKTDGVTAYEDALISSNRELFLPNISYKLKKPLATMHSFDETLKQLDKCISSKMRVDETSSRKRSSVIVSMDSIRKPDNNVVSSRKCDKRENHPCIHEHKDTRKIQEIRNLISDEVGSKRILMFNKYKKRRIELNLNSCFDKVSDSIESDDCKNVNTNCIKLDIGKKLHNDKKTISDKNKYSKHEDGTLNCTYLTEEVTKIKENTHERKSCKLIVSDKHKEIIKKRRKIKDRFRTYFGDCISISEDEQEQDIIEKRFRKRRNKDSVDSCDSGVYVAERNIIMTVAHVNGIHESNEDTSQRIANVDTSHDSNENTSQETIVNVDAIHESNEDTSQRIANVDTSHDSNENTSQETIVNVDAIHESNEDTSQRIANVDTSHDSNENTSQETIVNVDAIHESNEDTSQRIANVDTSHDSNENTSQETIVNVDAIHESNDDTYQGIIANVDPSYESNKDTSQETIVNVDVIHESNEGTSQEIIANVDTCYESNKDTSQETIINVDVIHESNEHISQETIVNVDVIHESNEDISQGTIVNVDTIHESNEVTDNTNIKTTNQIEDATNFIEIECNKLQNNIYENKTHNTEIEKGELFRNKKFINFSEKNNEKNKHASSVTDIFQITEQSEVNVSAKIKATTEINNILSSDIPEICTPSHDTITISKNFSGPERSNLDIKDFNDLLNMSFFETCQITSNGNVLSIQEIVMNADVGENSNLKELSEIQNNCNQSVTEKVLNCIEEDKRVQLSFNTNKIDNVTSTNNIYNVKNNENEKVLNCIEENKRVQLSFNTNKIDNVTSTNNISNVKNNENELAVENSELSISEKKDTHSNKLPQAKLRVLSSAELGSRWCPTPVNSVTSTVLQFSNQNTETQTVPETIASITAPVSETVSQTTVLENMRKCYMDPTFSELVYVILIEIRSLIQDIRISPITNLNYDKLLSIEFEKLRKILNTDDFVDLTKGVVTILNNEMLVTPSLSLDELFCYAPSVKSFYVHTSNKNKIILNSLNECQTAKSVGVSNQTILNRNRCCDAQVSQNVWTSSVQSRLQYLLSIASEQSQTLRSNIAPKQPQQNFQEQIVSPLQKNVLQSNILVNPTTVNNNNHNNNNMHQHTYKMQLHKNFTQQKVSNVNFAKQNPVTNMHVRQSYPFQYSSFPSTGRNQLGVHTSVPVTNASSVNQQYVSSPVFIPQTNAFYNVNVPNYTIQQNMNSSTHMSQGTQLQVVSQSVSSNHNIPQPVQTTVATNISHSVPKNSRHIEQKHQKVIPQKRIPMEVPQNRTSEQVASSRQLRRSKHRRLKKKKNLQVSLESTTDLFDILKYISDIQKLILLKQLDFYFSCTTWLQQQFTSEQWQQIHSQRSVLLYFQTLLKHLVEKTMRNLLPGKSQTNILTNIEIDVPKVIQITVKENKGICCQVEVSEGNQEHNAMNIEQDCTSYEENLNVTITQNQYGKEREATDNSQTNSSSIKQNLQSHQTLGVDVCQENKVEKEPNSFRNVYNSNTKEQNLDKSEKIIENIPQIVEEKLSVLSNIKLLNKDTLQQLNPHLVTVEISSKDDQVTVVDTNASSENTSKFEESEEYQEHQHLKGTSYDDLTVSSVKSPNNTEYFNNEELHNTLLEKPLTTYIKDVRSISMEAYLKIGVTNNVPANTMEENIEVEEIKICLYCGKPSTVACIICLEAKYCSRECFQLHWEHHYKDCSPVERSVCL